MRMIVIDPKDTDAKALVERLIENGSGNESALKTLLQMNPHIVDLSKLSAGTVLLVPDAPGFRAGESTSIAGAGFEALGAQMREAAEEVQARVRRGHELLATQRKELAGALKAAGVKRLIESDPDLKKQLDEAEVVFKNDQQQAKDTEKALEALQRQLAEELGALAKMLG